jgi:hypothetical protein
MCRCALLDPHSNSCDGDLGDPPPRRLASPSTSPPGSRDPSGLGSGSSFPGKDPCPASLGSCRWIAPRPALPCRFWFPRRDREYIGLILPGNFARNWCTPRPARCEFALLGAILECQLPSNFSSGVQSHRHSPLGSPCLK